MPKFLPDVPEVREDVADYLGEAQAVDAYVGVFVRRLEDAGQLERTLIVISGDHGMPGVPSGKCNLYDFGTQVPLVLHWPAGTTTPGACRQVIWELCGDIEVILRNLKGDQYVISANELLPYAFDAAVLQKK